MPSLAAATRLGKSPRPSFGPAAKMTARSIAFRNSRRLPGQAYRSNAWRASAENPSILLPSCLAKNASMCSASSIRSARAQRRKRQLDDVQAEEEVVAELARRDSRFQVAVRRRDQAHVGRSRAGLAHSLVAPLLKEPEQFRLEQERKIADLVEEQRPPFGRLNLALGIGDRAGERAPCMAEERRSRATRRSGWGSSP